MKRMTFLLLMIFGVMSATAQTPIVRAHLEPTSGILVGAPVRLVVEVLAPNYFTGSPDFPEFELENAIVVLPQERAQNTNAQINGITYAGIKETYFLYPQQPGDFQIPPAQLTVPYANKPPATTVAQVLLPTLTFHADLPPAARGLDYFLPTTQLTMQQRWSVPLKNLKAGDTIERTITVTATKMQAMLIPPLSMSAPEGIRVYPGQPIVMDQKTSTGEFVFGRRTESTKYFIQKAGDYTLPAIELKWWNLTAKKMMTATLPAIHFTAAVNPGMATEIPPEPEAVVVAPPKSVNPWIRYKHWIKPVILVILSLFVCYWILRTYALRLIRFAQTKYREWKLSEGQYFRHLMKACHRDDADAAYWQLLIWLRLRYPGLDLEEFLANMQDAALTEEVHRLGSVLFSSHSQAEWQGKALASALKNVRAEKIHVKPKTTHLVSLNP